MSSDTDMSSILVSDKQPTGNARWLVLMDPGTLALSYFSVVPGVCFGGYIGATKYLAVPVSAFAAMNASHPLALVSLAASAIFIPMGLGILGRLIAKGGSLSRELKEKTNLTGKLAIVTGGNCGIGLETCKQLVQWGAKVVMAGRDLVRIEAAALVVRAAAGLDASSKQVAVMALDLADLNSVSDFANGVRTLNVPIDFLINNAGVMTPSEFQTTKQGHELQFGTNHLGHFLLTVKLLDLLKKQNARIINVSSLAHAMGDAAEATPNSFLDVNASNYVANTCYARSKIANIWFTKELQKRLDADESTSAQSYCVHPGCVHTELGRHILKKGGLAAFVFSTIRSMAFKTAVQGAATQLHLVAAPAAQLVGGGYYADCRLSPTIAAAVDSAKAQVAPVD
eukprot:GHVT01001023.1.p2 GENE.GHVT01001023.1~~GHVT01001023.1.p2  ORF type:complete len:397 (+),score=75.11 GHVT01001023.1:457-1647(+)